MDHQSVTIAVWFAIPVLALVAAGICLWHTRRQLRQVSHATPIRLTPAPSTQQSQTAIAS